MAKIKVSDYTIKFLEQRTGSRHAFLLSGGGMMHLLESIGTSKIIEPIPTHHEQAAAIAADAYSRVNNTIGICMVTTGPGGTNALTGVAGAYMDSNPVIFISGQVSRANAKTGLDVRQRGIQEVELIPIVNSVTKYAALVQEPEMIRFHLEKALYLARSGRPGPVWLDIPLDVQAAIVEENDLKGFDADPEENLNPAPSTRQIEAVVSALKMAKRPLLVLGGGIHLSRSQSLVEPLIDALGIPTQTSWNGMDLIEENHPFFAGRANTFAPRYSNLIIQNCDLLLCIGARMGMQHTGYNVASFARGAHKIMVDLDPGEMNKPGLKIDQPLLVDAPKFMAALTERAKEISLKNDIATNVREWTDYCRRVKVDFPPIPSKEQVADEAYVNPQFFSSELSRALAGFGECVIPIGSSGMGHTVVTGTFPVRKGQRVFTSKGLAAMGYGLPSTVGACFAAGKKLTVTIIGDGGLQLNIQELQTIRHHRLPIKLFIWNNGGYHSIRMTQKGYFKGHYVGSTENSGVSFPELQKIADVYGFRYFKIENNKSLFEELNRTLDSEGPVICEVFIDPEKPLEPKLASYQQADGSMASRPLEDMAPLLDREELKRYMFIPLIT